MDRGRLSRGRSYARKGQVLSLSVDTGQVKASVQGSRSRPYKVVINIEPLTEEDWERVINSLLERPIFIAQLLAGEMPQDIEEAFSSIELSLFPSNLNQSCNCPDYASVCKHLAAVHYILAERFDEDPFLLFLLRGKSQDEIMAALSQHHTADLEDDSEVDDAPPLSPEGFWEIGGELSRFQTHIEAPEIPYPVLTRLGAPSFMEDIEQKLGLVYDALTQAALDAAFGYDEMEDDAQDDDPA
jgi:uncharacterized Zn finger protein